MELKNATLSVLDQLCDFLDQIMQDDYIVFVDSLDATIGQHVRHIAEFYICLFEGLSDKEINYDRRRRDKRIEQDKKFASATISEIKRNVMEMNNNPELNLRIAYGDLSADEIRIRTNFERELAYNIEHTIHHLAIIKTAFAEICEYVSIPENFGVASSTLRFRHSS